jgi:phosphate transport system substrate-binding protein
MALLQNGAGNYVEPTLESFTAAADVDMPADTRLMITNSQNPEAYPITSFTWIILYKEQAYRDRSEDAANATVNAVKWLTGANAQAIATSVHYASLPQKAAEQAATLLSNITFDGKKVLK